jgi:hypothetical protein
MNSKASIIDLPAGVELVCGLEFSEREYLEMNPDVRTFVAAGVLASGRLHFEGNGFKEGRLGLSPDHLSGFFGEQPYFVKGAVTYHDLANSLARPHSGTCLLRKQAE